jgi:hypothetical protein
MWLGDPTREEALMAFKDMLRKGFARASEEAKEALDKGKMKVGEMQLEMKLDGLAKKLGHLVFDAHRGRQVDEALRAKYLEDMAQLEDQIAQIKAEAAAKAEADTAAPGAASAPGADDSPSGEE